MGTTNMASTMAMGAICMTVLTWLMGLFAIASPYLLTSSANIAGLVSVDTYTGVFYVCATGGAFGQTDTRCQSYDSPGDTFVTIQALYTIAFLFSSFAMCASCAGFCMKAAHYGTAVCGILSSIFYFACACYLFGLTTVQDYSYAAAFLWIGWIFMFVVAALGGMAAKEDGDADGGHGGEPAPSYD